MKNILIVGALSQELNPIKKIIKKLILRNTKISYLTTGMGNYNMILNLTKFLEQQEKYDFIINIGVCGYKNKISLFQGEYPKGEGLEKIEGKIPDFIQVGRVLNVSNNKELIIPNIINFSKIQSIANSEIVVYDKDKIGDENYVDMESYGFEFVLEKYNIPRIILKIPVDKIGTETKNFDFKKAEKYLSENIDYEKLFEEINKYLAKNISENKDLTKYNNYFNFSFSQALIFKKLYNKFEVLTGEDFGKYFYDYTRGLEELENSKQESKKFLNSLENFLEDK